jgi:tetratricopeptide (TPR) repeat protein
MVVIVAIAVVIHQTMKDNPTAASANLFLNALTTKQEAEQSRMPNGPAVNLDAANKAFTDVATNESVTPYYRARAYIELTQIALTRSQLSDASTAIGQAKNWATQCNDSDLDLAVGLSEAAVALQKGEYPVAETLYLSVANAAGANNPDRQFAGIIGAAKAMELQNNLEGAIAKLEEVINRSDNNATMLINLAKNTYWSLKRRQATPAPAPAPAPAPEAPAPAPTGEAPQPAPAPAAPVEAPAPPATAAPAPVVPTNPEAK